MVTPFPEHFKKFDNKRVVISATFENGINQFYGVCKITGNNSYFNLYNSSEIYPPYPFLNNKRNLFIQVFRPGAGIVTLFNYTEFDEYYNITFKEQFEITRLKVDEDDTYYPEDLNKNFDDIIEKIDEIIFNPK
jgi:hypothetical protein